MTTRRGSERTHQPEATGGARSRFAWGRWLVAVLAVMLAAGHVRAECAGDCDGDLTVTVAEIVSGVNIALGTAPVATCQAMDANGSGAVTIEELIAAVSAALGACAGTLVSDYVTQVTVIDFGVVGTLRSGAPPPPSGGPTLEAAGAVTVVNGGTAEIELMASEPFTVVYFGVVGAPASPLAVAAEGGPAGVLTSGYYEVALPEPVRTVKLQVTIAQDVPLDSFGWLWEVGTGGGAVSAPATTSVEVVPVGSGDVQISVSWDSVADVDLHVVEPSGEEIYWFDTESATGGMLDLDALCDSTVRNENITWPPGRTPRGRYIVRLDYFESCGAEATNWVVTVQRTGAQPETFRGQFTGEGDFGGLGAGILITEFTF